MNIRRTRSSRGLSLIEVLFALSILSISLLALVPLFGMSVKTNSSSGQLATANTLAREKLEELICYPSTNVRMWIAANTTITDNNNPIPGQPNYWKNDLPLWYNPTTGAVDYTSTSLPGPGWFQFPLTRTYSVQAMRLSDPANAFGTPIQSTQTDESVYDAWYSSPPAPYYDVKLVTVTVQPTAFAAGGAPSAGAPGWRRTTQSAYVKFKVKQ